MADTGFGAGKDIGLVSGNFTSAAILSIPFPDNRNMSLSPEKNLRHDSGKLRKNKICHAAANLRKHPAMRESVAPTIFP